MTATIQHVAIHKAVPEDKFKSAIADIPNEIIIPVDVTARVIGAIKRGRPYVKRNAAQANPWKLLAVALSKLNDSTIEAVVRASEMVPEDAAKQIKKSAEEAIQRIVDSTEKTMPGNITATLQLEFK